MNRTPQQDSIDRFREYVIRRFGLNVENGNHDRLVEALQRGVGRTGSSDAALYLRSLADGALPPSELGALIEDLTVPETYFFRHPDQFRAVSERVIFERLGGARSGQRLRMLSAGCASGEEAYSLGVLVRDNLPPGGLFDVEVLGIDINANLLAKAARGRYTTWSLRGVAEELRRRHFRNAGGEFVLADSVRELVKFSARNLVEEDAAFWQPGAFDVIFCRNVIMYFTPEAARAVIARFARSLAPNGLLFLGPAETLRGVSQDFHLQHTHETFYYQRRNSDDDGGKVPEAAIAPAKAWLPEAPAVDQSWVATICRASERVTLLSQNALSSGGRNRESGGETGTGRGKPPELAASHRLTAARQLMSEERFDEALVALEMLPADERQNPDAQLLSAAVLTNRGRAREAERLCQDVLASDELNAEAHYLLALCREHSGEVAAAIDQNQVAIYLDPQFAMPHLHLGLLAKRTGDRVAASHAFRRAAALLAREDASRIVLFGGGFGREALAQLCQNEMRSMGASP